MNIRVGLRTTDLKSLKHSALSLSAPAKLTLSAAACGEGFAEESAFSTLRDITASAKVNLSARNNQIIVSATGRKGTLAADACLHVKAHTPGVAITVNNISRAKGKGTNAPTYIGTLEVRAVGNSLTIAEILSLDDYVRGVTESEMPASYHLEALKAQTVAARTYALKPRIDHTKDKINVCDSYLCCQYYAGHLTQISKQHARAIEETKGEILTYKGEPILALFSSCAGGHTENYENCFSNLKTGQFPDESKPYLKGVAEGELPVPFVAGEEEKSLRALWNWSKPTTSDGWSPKFKWDVTLTAQALEGQMHHVVDNLMKDPDMAPFVIPPASRKFGHIKSFSITKRGTAGTAMEMSIETSYGVWLIKKELVIRSAFHNTETGLARLKSARIFFEHKYDQLGLLSDLTIRGLGFGHGVGMQQVGAEGFARKGDTYRSILSHYFYGTEISHP